MMRPVSVLVLGIMVAGLASLPVMAEPLQNGLFVVCEPEGVMGKSPLYPVFKTADRSNAAAAKLYDAMMTDPKLREVFLTYQRAQTDSLRRYKEQLVREGKSQAEIDKLAAAKATPMYFVVKEGKGTPMMISGSGFVKTYRNGKLETDFQYVCPKIMVPKGWECFSSKPNEPLSEEERKEFINLAAHETGHAIMKEMYGYIPKSANPWAAFGHWEGKLTSPQLAFTEGYAEFMGAWYSGSDNYDPQRFTKDVDKDLPRTEAENKKVEGVVASILWDMAKGDHGLKDGIAKIHRVLREKKPWTIDGFSKGFKELFPADADAMEAILKQNLVTEKDNLTTCWVSLNSDRKRISKLEQEAAKLSWWGNPLQKTKAEWALAQAKSSYNKRLERYEKLFGYDRAVLTSPTYPKKAVPAPVPAAKNDVPVSGVKAVTVNGEAAKGAGNPFGE